MNQPNMCHRCGYLRDSADDLCPNCNRGLLPPSGLDNVVLIRPRTDTTSTTHEQKLVGQATFLRELAEAIENSDDVDQAAFAFVLKMKDGSLVVQTSGWADDQRAQQYFLTFSRNHGWPA
jgi:RNA polymerase subunit RPABC4/transcription elongation factor Spt4